MDLCKSTGWHGPLEINERQKQDLHWSCLPYSARQATGVYWLIMHGLGVRPASIEEASRASSTSYLGSFEMKLGLCELTSSFLLILQLCPDNENPNFPCRYWSCNSCATVLSGHPVAKPASRLFLSGQVYDTDYSDRWRDSSGLSTTLSLDQSASPELKYGSFLGLARIKFLPMSSIAKEFTPRSAW